jgi:hypothetical protein
MNGAEKLDAYLSSHLPRSPGGSPYASILGIEFDESTCTVSTDLTLGTQGVETAAVIGKSARQSGVSFRSLLIRSKDGTVLFRSVPH